MIKRTIVKGARVYKGSMHVHTSRSDGTQLPRDVMAIYRERGYDFIAITDHHIYWNDDSFNGPEFCVLGGTEIGFSWGSADYDTPFEKRCLNYHLNAYFDPASSDADKRLPHDYRWFVSDFDGKFIPENADTRGLYTVNFFNRGKENKMTIYDAVKDTIRFFKAHGNVVMINHPDWSRHLPEDDIGFEEAFAMEIYNHGSEVGSANGTSLTHYDEALRAGRRYVALATDDFHGRLSTIGGWIMVSAKALSPADLMAAIKSGSFYATTGPDIYDFYVEDGVAHAETSPVREISFITYEPRGANFSAPTGAYLHRAQAEIEPGTNFVRLEITDAYGKKAWSNPIFLK